MNNHFKLWRFPFVCMALQFALVCVSSLLHAQSGLRESLERLDRNENGWIDPGEVTPLARPYLERIMKTRSKRNELSFEKPIEISKLQEAARVYYATRNGVNGRDVRPEGESTVKPFGPDPDQPYVPEFGLAEVKFPYVQADLKLATEIIGRYDHNKDGFIDRAEAAENRWTHRNPFDDDLNKDDRISRMELTQRYARRRLLEGGSRELGRKAWRTGGEVPSSGKDKKKRDDSEWWRKGGTSHWLTASMMGRFDLNRNGRLEATEAQRLGMPLGQIDLDRDGEVSREELHALLIEMQDEAGDVTEGLPGWFYELDADRDGQVAIHEFTTEWTIAKHEEFDSVDANGDGLLTAAEVLQSKAMVGGSYQNEIAEVLPPRRTIISEIEVNDDFVIKDLNVELSITHSNDSFLDGYLTGPDGQRVELFAEVGGGGDHFEQTVFDDQSDTPITKAKPPFTGTFRPHALDKRQPGLSSFTGKNVKGVWQLVVRGTRSDRFGMLHSWGLTVKPQEDLRGNATPDSSQDNDATSGPDK